MTLKTAQVNRDATVWDNNDSDPAPQPPAQNHIPTPLPRYTPVQPPSNHARTQSSSQSEPTQEPSQSQEPSLKIGFPYKRMLLFRDL